MSRWQDLYKRVVVQWSETATYVAKPTMEDLLRFEAKFGCKLPEEVRSFISAFGAGVFHVYGADDSEIDFRFWSPECVENSAFDMTRFNANSRLTFEHYNEGESSLYSNPQLVYRMIYFGISYENGLLAWDPEDCTDPKTFDCRVHYWRHGERSTEIIAPSFREFIEAVCFGHAYVHVFGEQGLVVKERAFFSAAPKK